jgi:hypothetical protein
LSAWKKKANIFFSFDSWHLAILFFSSEWIFASVACALSSARLDMTVDQYQDAKFCDALQYNFVRRSGTHPEPKGRLIPFLF